METRIFYNAQDFYHFVQWYQGELTLKVHNKAYDKDGNLIAVLIKNK